MRDAGYTDASKLLRVGHLKTASGKTLTVEQRIGGFNGERRYYVEVYENGYFLGSDYMLFGVGNPITIDCVPYSYECFTWTKKGLIV